MKFAYITTRTSPSKLQDIGIIWKNSKAKNAIIAYEQEKEFIISTLPFRDFHVTQKNLTAVENLVHKTVADLKSAEVTCITGCWTLRHSGILEKYANEIGIEYPNGNNLFYALLPQAIRKATKENALQTEDITIAVKTENPKLAEEFLINVSGMFKYAVIIGGNEFLNVAEKVCSLCGLAIRVCPTAYADITVNLDTKNVFFDLYGEKSESVKIVNDAVVNLKNIIKLPVKDEILDLPLAEWYLKAQYEQDTIEQATKKSHCKIKRLLYKDYI